MQFETDVKEMIKRTKDIISIRFNRPEKFYYLAGQYMFITLGSSDSEMTKHFTLSSSPTESFLEITKRLTGHPFSNALEQLNAGDKVKIRGPYGNFTFQGEYGKVGMLSGGIGITPLRSIIRYSIDNKLGTNMILLYSNSYEDDIAFGDELEELQKQNPNLKVVNIVTKPGPGWKGTTGRINAEIVKTFIPDYMERTFYSSGSRKMVDAMVSLLREMTVPDGQIKKEFFPGFD